MAKATLNLNGKRDEPKILSSGFDVLGTATPVGISAPVDFTATMGNTDGEIELVWSEVYGAMSYVIQCSLYATPRVWTQASIVAESKAAIFDCTPGERLVFRVAAVGVEGQSPWSDEAVATAQRRVRSGRRAVDCPPYLLPLITHH